jgi:CheY-like chemotaxis protein
MTDDLPDAFGPRGPVAGRPLNGLTILVVEDSRFACDAIRLLCLRSGARIRRADCLRSARRHLQTYRPAVVIIDLGLPDGSGADLIAELSRAPVRVPAIVATSGDAPDAATLRKMGADAFLPKPVESLADFQRVCLTALARRGAPDLRLVAPDDRVSPDPLAYRDDLNAAAAALDGAPDPQRIGYVAQFISGVARSAHDEALATAARDLAHDQAGGRDAAARVGHLSRLVQDRLRAGAAF